MEKTAETGAPLSDPPKDAAGTNGAGAPAAAEPSAAAQPTAAAEPATAAEPSADAEPSTEAEAAKAQRPRERSARASALGQIDDLMAAVRRLEAFAADEAKRVSDKLVPQIETRAKQNIWVSLLIALGLGLILGMWVTRGSRRG